MDYLNEDFVKDLPKGDVFQTLQTMEGKVYRDVQGRKTLQFALAGKRFLRTLFSCACQSWALRTNGEQSAS